MKSKSFPKRERGIAKREKARRKKENYSAEYFVQFSFKRLNTFLLN